MGQQRVDFNPATGDQTGAALVKLDSNCADLDGRVTTAQSAATAAQATANGAMPKVGGDFSGPISATRVSCTNGQSSQSWNIIASNNVNGDYLTFDHPGGGYYNSLIIYAGGLLVAGGKTVWTTGNTTVDANNFIKKV